MLTEKMGFFCNHTVAYMLYCKSQNILPFLIVIQIFFLLWWIKRHKKWFHRQDERIEITHVLDSHIERELFIEAAHDILETFYIHCCTFPFVKKLEEIDQSQESSTLPDLGEENPFWPNFVTQRHELDPLTGDLEIFLHHWKESLVSCR